MPGSGGMRAQPAVVGGRVFLGSDNGFVYALDARSGCVHWSFEAGTPVVSAVSVGSVRRGRNAMPSTSGTGRRTSMPWTPP